MELEWLDGGVFESGGSYNPDPYGGMDQITFFTGGSDYMNFLPGEIGGGGGIGGGIVIDIGGLGGGGGGGGGGAPSLNQTLTQIVNDYEYQLKANLALWENGAQTASNAVTEGWRLMNAMVTAVLAYGAAGQKAAAERDRRINPTMLRWDWIRFYIDPITGGNTALPPVPGGGINAGNTLSAGFGGDNVWLIVAVLVVFYLANRD
jgi:hypothetical protein